MPSFDIVCQPNWVEINNAKDQANREISARFDFKNSDSRIEQKAEEELHLYADDEFKLEQVRDIFLAKCAKRQVDARQFKEKSKEKISGNKLKAIWEVKTGIDKELAKTLSADLKASKLKIQTSIQGDTVRVTGAKRDVLQEAIAAVKAKDYNLPLDFDNYRD